MADISKITPLGSSTTYNLKDNNAPRKDGTGATGTWGINISGSAALNVLKTGDTMTGTLIVPKLTINSTTAIKHLEFSREGYNYITMPDHNDAVIAIGIGASAAGSRLSISKTAITPGTNNGTIDLGSSSYKWRYIYGTLKGNADTATTATTADTATTATKATKDGDGNTISSTYVKISGSVMTGRLGFKISLAKGSTPSSSTGSSIQFYDNAGTAQANRLGMIYSYVDTSGQSLLSLYAYDNTSGSTSSTYFGIYKTTGDVRRSTTNAKIYGAVWNDYAEYRKDNLQEKELQKPGRCVKEVGDGTLALTTNRLERGCEIISDTFGFAIGEDPENGYNTPVASTGRVLAYPYETIEEFASHIGWSVCSGPNGTVSIMTEEEEEKYQSRIIGTISEIPDYEEWGQDKIKVNNRIWIRIR